jgi:hypothetical protein
VGALGVTAEQPRGGMSIATLFSMNWVSNKQLMLHNF